MKKCHKNVKVTPRDKQNTIFDIIHSTYSTLALRVAYELNLFEIIDKNKGMTFDDVVQALNIPSRGAQVILSMCSSLGLIYLNSHKKFELSEISQDYLLKDEGRKKRK